MPGHIFSRLGMAQPRWQHQRIMRNIIANYYKLAKAKRKLELIPAAEIDDEVDAFAPDILFVNKASESIVFIEIDHSKRLSENARVRRALDLFEAAPQLQEVFFYNYQTGEWSKLHQGGDTTQKASFSDVLEIDLLTLIKAV